MGELNKKGFTLIELLAVIVILGVLLLIAVPSMNSVIEGSKKDAFVSNAMQYINGVRTQAIQGEYDLPTPGKFTVVAANRIELFSGSENSPYSSPMVKDKTYVVIVNYGDSTTDKYNYYYAGVDAKQNGIKLTKEAMLARESVSRGGIGEADITLISGLNVLNIDGQTLTLMKSYAAL